MSAGGLVKARSSRTAMSGVIGDLPLTISDNVLRLTPSALAVSVTVSPSGTSTSSLRPSPGCGSVIVPMVHLNDNRRDQLRRHDFLQIGKRCASCRKQK